MSPVWIYFDLEKDCQSLCCLDFYLIPNSIFGTVCQTCRGTPHPVIDFSLLAKEVIIVLKILGSALKSRGAVDPKGLACKDYLGMVTVSENVTVLVSLYRVYLIDQSSAVCEVVRGVVRSRYYYFSTTS